MQHIFFVSFAMPKATPLPSGFYCYTIIANSYADLSFALSLLLAFLLSMSV